ncbi:MAG: xanthine dehydrogenase family protein subunit M [Candidatus Acidiferrales bacterium]
MKSYVPGYEIVAPRNLADALELFAREPGVWQPFAGGTDLMVLLEAGKLPHRRYVSIWDLRELRGIEATPSHVTLGALTTYTDVQRDATLQREFPLICRAAAETGGIATQNRGTLGGNIANGSPAADSPPALLVYDAELELVSARGARRVPYHGFHSGYKKMDLRGDELIARIVLPRGGTGWKSYYRKVGTRRAQAISKVCFTAAMRLRDGIVNDVRIALGSVAPAVVRAARTEAALRGKALNSAAIANARAILAEEIAPIDDIRSTARYRRAVAQNLLEEFLRGALTP